MGALQNMTSVNRSNVSANCYDGWCNRGCIMKGCICDCHLSQEELLDRETLQEKY